MCDAELKVLAGMNRYEMIHETQANGLKQVPYHSSSYETKKCHQAPNPATAKSQAVSRAARWKLSAPLPKTTEDKASELQKSQRSSDKSQDSAPLRAKTAQPLGKHAKGDPSYSARKLWNGLKTHTHTLYFFNDIFEAHVFKVFKYHKIGQI